MKEVSISRLLNLDLEDFHKRIGTADGKTAYVGFVFISHEDAAILKRNQRRKFRAKYPQITKKAIDRATDMYWLQYGPVTYVGKAIRPGYALIDNAGIAKDKAEQSKPYEYTVTAVPAELTRFQKIKAAARALFEKHFVFRG